MISIENLTEEQVVIQDLNVSLLAGEKIEINQISVPLWANSDTVISLIADGTLCVWFNETDGYSIKDQLSILNGDLTKKVSSLPYPFAAKNLPDGEKIFMRMHGISAVVSGAEDNIDFVVPYSKCKITGLHVINGQLGDKVNLKVLDSDTGLVSGIPNLQLNQFGFDCNIASSFHQYESSYDADLYQGMVVRVEYDAINGDLLPKTIYINLIIHEIV